MTKISQPTVETITAELHVVKIGNKQMTISVFNQLYEQDCWDGEWNIIYPVWGKTNRDGQYVIFQKGNELRKCAIPRSWGKLNYRKNLLEYIIDHANEIRTTIPKENLNYANRDDKAIAYSRLQTLTYNSYSNLVDNKDFEQALSVLDERILNDFKQYFQKRNWLNEQREKMIVELNNSRQLFIAV